MSVTSAMRTEALGWRLRRPRIAEETSPADSATRRRLIQQRLEQVMVHPVDERHLYVGASERLGRGESPEPTADDRDAASSAAAGLSGTSGLPLALLGADHDHVEGVGHHWYSWSRSTTTIRAAASISARCEKACGKLPRWRPVGASNSSA